VASDIDVHLPKDLIDVIPGPILPVSQALDAHWPREATHVRDFEGGTFRLASVDEFPASKTMSGELLAINSGKQRNLHWHTNANEWNDYLCGKGQVALFGSGGCGKLRARGIGSVIPEPDDQKASRRRGSSGGRPVSYDKNAYRGRIVIEHAFNGFKHWRGLATRYDRGLR
jgi:hypothetical protein